MTLIEIVTKLEAIRKRLTWLENAHYRDQKISVELVDNSLEQLSPAVDDLRKLYPQMLDGFRPHNYKSHLIEDPYDYKKHNKFYWSTVAHFIKGDIDYYLECIPPREPERGPLASMKITKEGMFLSGQYFDAFIKMAEIIHSAKKDVIVIDGYIGEKLLKVFTVFGGKIPIRVLTHSIPAALQPHIDNFNIQYNNSLEVRVKKTFHDRFIIFDESEFYHVGASIKDAGSRGFMFSQIEEPLFTKMLLNEFNSNW